MLRSIAAVVCVGWLALGASLPSLHAHVYADHDHPEHRHGLAFHEHHHVVDHGAFERTGIAPCEPDGHVVSLQLSYAKVRIVDGAGLASSAAPLPEPDLVLAPAAARRDVRVHGPPRLTDGPLRAPPASRPA